MKKTVIWDLWGGGLNSLRSALRESKQLSNFLVYTFDIVPKSNNFNNIVFDLATDNIEQKFDKLIKSGKIEKPDYIICSPLCQSFSIAMQSISNLKDSKGKYFSGNPHHYWNYETKKICRWPRNKNIKWNGFSGNSYPNGSKSVPKYVSELGERCCQNAIKLICYFQPKCWYIENPAKSMMWKYIYYNLGFESGRVHIAHYSAYDKSFSKKPTGFLSNVNLKLEKSSAAANVLQISKNEYVLTLSGACKDKIKDERRRKQIEEKLSKKFNKKIIVKIVYKKNSMERSKVPSKLLISIINQFKNYQGKHNKFKCKKFSLTPYSNKPKKIDEMVKEVII